ncbi:S46 family peptidase, partial [Stenotrophomonas maltophilia]|uniref:S46 family peptidase n=1 Tax=Stenotrophomonas maltophilia TaxID=40324 RepID=UPI003144E1F8
PDQPDHYQKFAAQPLGADDFVIVAVYPGRSNRYALAGELNETASFTYQTIAKHYDAVLKMFDDSGKAVADVK